MQITVMLSEKQVSHLEKIHKLRMSPNAGCRSLHYWLYNNICRPDHCENDITHQSKRFVWASLNHLYTRNPSDYVQLCSSCHSLYDRGKITVLGKYVWERGGKVRINPSLTIETKAKIGLSLKGRPKTLEHNRKVSEAIKRNWIKRKLCKE